MKTNWWIESGMAAQAAQELVWFVVLVVVGIGVVIWKDMREDKPVQRGTVRQGDKNESK